jgi:hypothetical protein
VKMTMFVVLCMVMPPSLDAKEEANERNTKY